MPSDDFKLVTNRGGSPAGDAKQRMLARLGEGPLKNDGIYEVKANFKMDVCAC
jgi:hypothetical protein